MMPLGGGKLVSCEFFKLDLTSHPKVASSAGSHKNKSLSSLPVSLAYCLHKMILSRAVQERMFRVKLRSVKEFKGW